MILTGSEVVDQIFSVLLSTSMFVGGVTGFVLDNTVPGNVSATCLRLVDSVSVQGGAETWNIGLHALRRYLLNTGFVFWCLVFWTTV